MAPILQSERPVNYLKHPVIKACLAAALTLLAGFSALVIVMAIRWPFGPESLTKRIKSGTEFNFQFTSYRRTWFPPGLIAENIRVTDPSSKSPSPVLTAKTLTVEGTYLGLLHTPVRIPVIRLNGARVAIPALGMAGPGRRFNAHAEAMHTSKNAPQIGEVQLFDSALEVNAGAEDTGKVTHFAIHRLILWHWGAIHNPMRFDASMADLDPRFEIETKGSIGPFIAADPFAMKLTSDFTVKKFDLAKFDALEGEASAAGKCAGTLHSVICSGTVDSPDFQVRAGAHPVHAAGDVEANINVKTGDVDLKRFNAHFNQTTLLATGELRGGTANLAVTTTSGRVEDLLVLFSKDRPSMNGEIEFSAHVRLPPAPPKFLTRLAVDGDFFIKNAKFANPGVQKAVSRLSGSARGVKKRELKQNPPDVNAHLHGHIVAANAVSRMSAVRFAAPGIEGQIGGTFGLRSKALNMAGEIYTGGKLSDTTTGMKSFMLSVMTPFLWHKHDGKRTIAFRITGDSSHPSFRLKL